LKHTTFGCASLASRTPIVLNLAEGKRFASPQEQRSDIQSWRRSPAVFPQILTDARFGSNRITIPLLFSSSPLHHRCRKTQRTGILKMLTGSRNFFILTKAHTPEPFFTGDCSLK
jgi:hypothetical protein